MTKREEREDERRREEKQEAGREDECSQQDGKKRKGARQGDLVSPDGADRSGEVPPRLIASICTQLKGVEGIPGLADLDIAAKPGSCGPWQHGCRGVGANVIKATT
jgi:hypothetical protein